MKIKRTSKYKKAIARRDGIKCNLCGSKNIHKLSVDHIIPISMGGGTGVDNLQFLCLSCHTEKDKYVGQLGYRGRIAYKTSLKNKVRPS